MQAHQNQYDNKNSMKDSSASLLQYKLLEDMLNSNNIINLEDFKNLIKLISDSAPS